MKVLLISAVCGITGVGRIVTDSARELAEQGHEVKIAYSREPMRFAEKKDTLRIGSRADMLLHGALSRILDNQGLNSACATRAFLKQAEAFSPDMVWLHNLHGYYLNYPLLFRWIKSRPQMQVRWTLHDCWSFTGHCAHFAAAKCEKWRSGCHDCPQKRVYPASLLLDGSRRNYEAKKAAFTGVPNLVIQCPSQWMARRIRQSFLGEYPVEVVPNRIDRDIFRPTESDFRRKYHLEGQKIVLAAGTTWTENKGMGDYIRLPELLPKGYRLVLAGIGEKQAAALPESILCIPRTDSPRDMAALYTAADVLVSASREESFGLTVLEAAACGTRAVVYRDTACEEVAKSCGGMAVDMNAEALRDGIVKSCTDTIPVLG